MSSERDRRQRFEELFLAHERAVRAYALRRAPADIAQDAVSETFLIAWRRFDDLPAEPLPWLYGTARKVLANARRRLAHQSEIAERIGREPAAVSDDLADRVGDAATIRAALGRLGHRDRETLMLVAWEGLDPADAARASGCTRAAFAVRLHRARTRLERELSLEDHTPQPEAMGA